MASVSQPLGPGTVTAAFAGDDLYLPFTDSKPNLLYAFVAGAGTGAFVVGDKSATPEPSRPHRRTSNGSMIAGSVCLRRMT